MKNVLREESFRGIAITDCTGTDPTNTDVEEKLRLSYNKSSSVHGLFKAL